MNLTYTVNMIILACVLVHDSTHKFLSCANLWPLSFANVAQMKPKHAIDMINSKAMGNVYQILLVISMVLNVIKAWRHILEYRGKM